MKTDPRPRPAATCVASGPDLGGSRFIIEDVFPTVDSGRFPVKRVAGEPVEVWADIFRDGHVVLAAELIWRAEDSKQRWRNSLKFHQNDRWYVSFTPPAPGRYRYAIEAWTD